MEWMVKLEDDGFLEEPLYKILEFRYSRGWRDKERLRIVSLLGDSDSEKRVKDEVFEEYVAPAPQGKRIQSIIEVLTSLHSKLALTKRRCSLSGAVLIR